MTARHLRIHGAASFASRHKLSSVHHLLHRGLGFEPQVLEPQFLAHLHAISLGSPEIRSQSAVHGKANEVQRNGGAVREDGLFEVNQFKSALHGETLNVTRRLWKVVVCFFCVLVDSFGELNTPAAFRIAHHTAANTDKKSCLAPISYGLRCGLVVTSSITNTDPLPFHHRGFRSRETAASS